MPKHLKYRPDLIDNLISNARIKSYQSVFNPSCDHELAGSYLWNSHVCSAIYPLIGAAEITLRNSINNELTTHYSRFWWKSLRYKSYSPGAPLPNTVQRITENFSKATATVKKEKKNRYPLSKIPLQHDDVIAKTEFSTWEFLLDTEFMGPTLIWPKHLGLVFQGSWPSKSANTTLTTARNLVKTVREFRNRLFHYEPAWKKHGVLNEHDAIAHLHDKLNSIETLLKLLHPEKHRMLVRNGLIAHAYRASSLGELRRFQLRAPDYSVKTISKMRTLFRHASASNNTLKFKSYDKGTRYYLLTPL